MKNEPLFIIWLTRTHVKFSIFAYNKYAHAHSMPKDINYLEVTKQSYQPNSKIVRPIFFHQAQSQTCVLTSRLKKSWN